MASSTAMGKVYVCALLACLRWVRALELEQVITMPGVFVVGCFSWVWLARHSLVEEADLATVIFWECTHCHCSSLMEKTTKRGCQVAWPRIRIRSRLAVSLHKTFFILASLSCNYLRLEFYNFITQCRWVNTPVSQSTRQQTFCKRCRSACWPPLIRLECPFTPSTLITTRDRTWSTQTGAKEKNIHTHGYYDFGLEAAIVSETIVLLLWF